MAAGDRWSDDADDRIEWHVDRTRHWVRIGVILFVCFHLGEVLVHVLA